MRRAPTVTARITVRTTAACEWSGSTRAPSERTTLNTGDAALARALQMSHVAASVDVVERSYEAATALKFVSFVRVL